ncbi:uncharacterized protein PAC_16312 [Phialocephala subalpina]|uniref:Uncharacterized protein n=1 Tax=Phialocephala subalpina TaxID=576137 RepID=A0A1L7XMX2_9HELO|nr:uncharacterized protein PAC_16312 [Phialocephala subalpina]
MKRAATGICRWPSKRAKNGSAPATSGVSASMPPPGTSSGTISISPLLMANPFSGQFDGYAVELKFLRNRCLVPGTTKLDFSALYVEIIRRQSLNQRTFGFNIGVGGGFICPEIAGPMGDEPLDPLLITGSVKDIVKFEPKEWTLNPKLGAGPGYEGKIE